MQRFPLVKNTDDSDVQTLYEDMVAHGMQGVEEGLPVNCFTALGDQPELLRGLWELTKNVVGTGALPPTVKQMVAMVISLQNECRYCSVAHTSALESMGVPTEVIKSCAADPELTEVPPPQRAIIKFALKVVRTPHDISDEDMESLRDQGLGDGEIKEVIMLAAWSHLINIWTDVAQVPLDGETA